jgi:hypothetical protein
MSYSLELLFVFAVWGFIYKAGPRALCLKKLPAGLHPVTINSRFLKEKETPELNPVYNQVDSLQNKLKLRSSNLSVEHVAWRKNYYKLENIYSTTNILCQFMFCIVVVTEQR